MDEAARAGTDAMPGVRAAAGPKGSVWIAAASMPIAARPAPICSMNALGPHMYASAFRGTLEPGDERGGEASGGVVVAALDIFGPRAAVAHVARARSRAMR